MLGIECDGAKHHCVKSARPRPITPGNPSASRLEVA
jgi:hypothetical protein